MRINIFLNKKFLKDKYIKEAFDDYFKRCSKVVNIRALTSLDENLLLDSTSYNINVSTIGKYINSIELSNIINSCSLNRFKNINIIFSYNGNCTRNNICFSNINILHTGFLYVMVMEQIYRSYKIINNEPYHK